MRYINAGKIAETVESLYIAANYHLPDDILAALKRSAEKESNPKAARILGSLVENARIAASQSIPLCQDTGIAVVFCEQGAGVAIRASNKGPATLAEAINTGIKKASQKGYLRRSLCEPLKTRINTGTNTPAIIHHTTVPGEKLRISVLAKGGGCENKSQFRMFKPTAEKKQIIDWITDTVKQAGPDACPPFIVGVGIGGDFELSCLLSKKALLRDINKRNPDRFYARLESELLRKINALGLGPQGLGGDTTALAVLIETAPCHIASLPVAINIECHSHRHKTAVI